MAEKELKICEYCGKEYKPRVTDQKYCGKQCRWDYNNALKAQKLEVVDKQVDGVYTPSHASESVITTPVEVAPKIEQPRVSETALAEVIATVVGQVIIEKLGSEFAGLGDIIGNKIKEAVKEVALMQVSPPMERTDLPKVPFPKPMELDTDELPLIEVKVSEGAKKEIGEQNFLNSLLALG